jgi:hypothetical protein
MTALLIFSFFQTSSYSIGKSLIRSRIRSKAVVVFTKGYRQKGSNAFYFLQTFQALALTACYKKQFYLD